MWLVVSGFVLRRSSWIGLPGVFVNRVVGLLFGIDQPAEQIRRVGGALQALLKFGLLKQNATDLFPSSNLF